MPVTAAAAARAAHDAARSRLRPLADRTRPRRLRSKARVNLFHVAQVVTCTSCAQLRSKLPANAGSVREAPPLTEEEKRTNLMGSARDLDECVVGAESADEVVRL